MNTFTQYIPNFVECSSPPPEIPFETIEDLLNIECVKYTAEIPKFERFVLDGHYLMVVLKGGLSWWIVGAIQDPTKVPLPQWDGGHYKVQYRDGTIAVLNGSVVKSLCGDVITLKDGTVVKYLRY